MHSLQSKDVYVLTLLGIVAWIFLDVITIVTNGPVFAILNSTNILIWSGMLALLVAITYIIFNIFAHIMFFVKDILANKNDHDTSTKLANILPQSLVLLALYIILLVSQALWYIFNSQTF